MKNQIIIGLFLFAAFCVAPVFAQETSSNQETAKKPLDVWKSIKEKREKVSEEQVKAYCTKDFVGEPINLNVVNADITDILNYITNEYGYDFVIDKSVKVKPVTMKVDNAPWNVVLNEILKANDLAIQCNGQILRITEIKTLADESLCVYRIVEEKENEPIYTKIIKLKNLPSCPNDIKCKQLSVALNRLKKVVSRRLTKRGAVEYDERSQTLIATDVRGNLDSIKYLVELLDNSNFYNQSEENK